MMQISLITLYEQWVKASLTKKPHQTPPSALQILPDLAQTHDTMPVTFAKMGLRPSFRLQYGPYGWCSFSPGRVLNDIGRKTTPASIP
jgi:hypothetical protein